MMVEIKNIRKSFGKQVVLHHFSFGVQEGEIVCLMGASGAGKTTLLRMLAGLLQPDGGEITGLKGKRISMVFQENRLLAWADAETNVMAAVGTEGLYGAKREKTVKGRGKRSEEKKELLRREFAAVGLTESEYENKPVMKLSGGMQRRVALVRAVCADSDLLLLDEPFTGLDEQTRARAIDYLFARKGKRSVILATHDREVAEMLKARIVRIPE